MKKIEVTASSLLFLYTVECAHVLELGFHSTTDAANYFQENPLLFFFRRRILNSRCTMTMIQWIWMV